VTIPYPVVINLRISELSIIKPAIKQTNLSLHFVIPAKAGIQHSQQLFWIPALRYATAGMTYLIAGLIISQKRILLQTKRIFSSII